MVEPSDNLQAVFEKAIDTAKKLHHEYLTIEHLLFAMLLEDSFSNTVTGYGANTDDLRKNLSDYLQNKCTEIATRKLNQLSVCLIVRSHKYCLMVVNALNLQMCSLL